MELRVSARQLVTAGRTAIARDPAGIRVAIIPARGGSKRIPGKNIRDFLGQPAIAYPIAAAQRSALFDRIVVSTDCPRIAEIAVSFGAEVPCLRPAALADDHCGTLPVFQHAVATVEQLYGVQISAACCIYATAVLISERYLIEAYRQLTAAPSMAYCFSVCLYDHPIQRALCVDDSGVVAAVSGEHIDARTQDLPRRYFDAGQFYWARVEAVRAGIPLFCGPSIPYVLRRMDFADINEPDDWEQAEAFAAALKLDLRLLRHRRRSSQSVRTSVG